MKHRTNEQATELSVDQAVSEFMAALKLRPPGDAYATAAAPELSSSDADEARFRLAAQLLSWMCPDPTSCADPTCRRHRQCRHFVDLMALQQVRSVSSDSRRPPGAVALRRAIHLYWSRERSNPARKLQR